MKDKKAAEDYLFEKLKDILFEDERNAQKKLHEEIVRVDHKLEHRQELEPKVEPIINDKVVFMQQNFNNLFGTQVTQSIKDQIRNSQDEVVEALYPIIGKMIKKYIVKELEMLKDSIDSQVNNLLTFDGIKSTVKGWFGGTSKSDIILGNLMEPQLEEIFIIEQDSGILLGSYSKSNTVDQDMIAGMLTAIKAFAGDAFSKGDQDLELIEYETYKLFIKNFKSFYVMAAVSGAINNKFKNDLDDTMLNFVSKILKSNEYVPHQEGVVNNQLQQFFSQIEESNDQ